MQGLTRASAKPILAKLNVHQLNNIKRIQNLPFLVRLNEEDSVATIWRKQESDRLRRRSRLLRKGGAAVAFFDPHMDCWEVDQVPVERVEDLSSVSGAFEGLVLVTDHSIFHGLDVCNLAAVCVDTRGVLGGDRVVGL